MWREKRVREEKRKDWRETCITNRMLGRREKKCWGEECGRKRVREEKKKGLAREKCVGKRKLVIRESKCWGRRVWREERVREGENKGLEGGVYREAKVMEKEK